MTVKQTNQPKPSRRRYWLRLLAAAAGMLAIGLLLLLAGLIWLQVSALITPARNGRIEMSAVVDLPYQDVAMTTADNLTLSGWYIPGTKPYGIVLVHGINTNRQAVLPQARVLAGAGYHLLLLDLRGHGRSQGNQVTYGYREALDVQAATDYLLALPDVEQVGALGASMGGAAVARAAASDSRLAAVVIESSYSSLPAAVEDAFDDFTIFPKWPFAPLVIALAEYRVGVEVSQVDSARDLATLSPRPVFIIHGARDGLVPPYHAQTMYEAAGEPKELWLIDQIGHGSAVRGRETEYSERVVSFFERAFTQ